MVLSRISRLHDQLKAARARLRRLRTKREAMRQLQLL
jgi:hypothetical protein